MPKEENTIDAAIAMHNDLTEAFERAAKDYEDAEKAGKIGFEAYCRMIEVGDNLIASAAALQKRINEALKEVNVA